MCDAVSAGMMIAGTAMQYKAQQDAAKRADKRIAYGEGLNDKYNNQIIDTTAANSEQYNPQTRQQNIGKSQEAAVVSLRDYLDKARDAGMGKNTDTTQGRVSETYTTDRAKRAIDTANKADVVARLMAKIRGVSDLQTDEAINNTGAASKVGTLANNRGNMARANGIDVAQSANPNPGMMLAGSMMSGYGVGNAVNNSRTQTPKKTG